jgi:hypothetical protein
MLKVSHIFLLSSSSPIPHQQIMDIQPPQRCLSESKFGQLAGISSNMALIGTQHEPRHQVVHHQAGDAAIKHMTKDADLKTVSKTASSTNKKQHAVGCDYHHSMVNGHQLTV